MNRTVSLTSSPMGITKHIPNILTLSNLACGAIGVVLDFEYSLAAAAIMIFAGAFFDFLDGFSARLLKVSNELGKKLDSMADMVTFGVLPAIIAFKLIELSMLHEPSPFGGSSALNTFLPYGALLIAVLSGLRLAKFNIDKRQSDSFIGMPTPINAMFWAAIPLMMLEYNSPLISHLYIPDYILIFWNKWFLLSCVLVLSILLVTELPMIALKFKNLSWKDNKVRFIFLGFAILTIIGALLINNVFISLPIILLLYLVISIVNNLISKGNEVQSRN